MPPKLVEGWIKRVLAAINPFNQRMRDPGNNAVNTDVSLLTQAGKRWEGNIALTLENINDIGLIEIYETVLNRGQTMSIGSGIDFPAANDALLLAAGYLADLYTIAGNEAYADAANPTISIDDSASATEVNTSRFSFESQVKSAPSGGAGSILQVAPGGVPASTLTVGAKNIDSTFAGVIRNTSTGGSSGPFSLTQTGTGTLTLSGTNTYTGSTAINGGRLHLTGSAASSAFTINSGSTLSGTGTVGALTINAGGTLSPGTLSAGATTFASGGAMTWEITNATGVSGNNYDLLSISGGLTINATSGSPFTINLTSLTLGNVAGLAANFDSASSYTFTFVTTTTGISGFSIDKFALNTAGFTNPSPAHGPSLAGGAMLAFAAWRRRRNPRGTTRPASAANPPPCKAAS